MYQISHIWFMIGKMGIGAWTYHFVHRNVALVGNSC
jgi:hypothetical protein